MNIVHIYYSLNYGGIETLLVNIANLQVKKSNKVTIILINKTINKDLIQLVDNKINIVFLNKRSKIDALWTLFKLNFYLFKEKCDVIHIHAAEIANMINPFIKTRKILHVHATEGITNSVVPKCDECISISFSVKTILEKKYNISSKVIFNGVDFPKFSQKKSNILSNQIVSIGALNSNKNQACLIREFNLIRSYIGADLHIIGAGDDERKLKALINELNLNDRVFLLGQKSQQWIQKNLCKYDLFVQASYSEGLGIAAIEASASCVPVLLSNTDGHIEVTKNGLLGELFDPNKDNDLGKKILKFYENPSKYLDFARENRSSQNNRFNLEEYNQKILELYRI